MIKAEGISYSYNRENSFIKDLSVEFEKGKITTIIGPNGCGKSTLLSLLCGHNKVKKGAIYINNKNIIKMKYKEIAKELSTVHQHNSVPNDITLYNLVSYGRLPHKKSYEGLNNEDKEIVDWAIGEMGLKEFEDKQVMSMSGGERQRAFIAMALAQQTKILFLDEPTTYLDIYHQIEILEMIKKLNKEYNTTIIMVLHDINQALKYSDNIIVMKNGAIVKVGKAKIVINEDLVKKVYGVNGVLGRVTGSNEMYFFT